MLIFSTFGISSALIGMGVYFHFKGLEEKLCLNGLSGNGTTSISTLSTNGTGKTDMTKDGFRGNDSSILWMLGPPESFCLCKNDSSKDTYL